MSGPADPNRTNALLVTRLFTTPKGQLTRNERRIVERLGTNIAKRLVRRKLEESKR